MSGTTHLKRAECFPIFSSAIVKMSLVSRAARLAVAARVYNHVPTVLSITCRNSERRRRRRRRASSEPARSRTHHENGSAATLNSPMAEFISCTVLVENIAYACSVPEIERELKSIAAGLQILSISATVSYTHLTLPTKA